MARDTGPWRDGRRAWERLNTWYQDNRRSPRRAVAADAAVEALGDIGLVRHLLDQAELLAVRTARRYGKSWAEIATALGITRQSAWERWRDIDDEPDTTDVVSTAAAELLEQRTREWRRRSTVVVPNVVGMRWDDARHALMEKQLIAMGADPDGPPLAAAGWPNAVVTDQSPESGARVPAGSSVRLWIERGGGSAGVREPRRPKPTPKSGREMREEPSDEAVG